MTRRRSRTGADDVTALLASDAPAPAVALALGITAGAVRQRRARLGVRTGQIGRPRQVGGRLHLLALGRRVLDAAAARSLSPDEFMDAAERAVPTTKGTKR